MIPRLRPRGMTYAAALVAVATCLSALNAVALNQLAPNFALMNSHRQKRTLANYKGEIVFINFWGQLVRTLSGRTARIESSGEGLQR